MYRSLVRLHLFLMKKQVNYLFIIGHLMQMLQKNGFYLMHLQNQIVLVDKLELHQYGTGTKSHILVVIFLIKDLKRMFSLFVVAVDTNVVNLVIFTSLLCVQLSRICSIYMMRSKLVLMNQ